MFGWFKSKSVAAPVEPVVEVDDTDYGRDPNVRGSQLTPLDFRLMQEQPIIADFMRAYPLTRLCTLELSSLAYNAFHEVQEDDVLEGRAPDGTQADRIYARAWDKMLNDHEMEVANRAEDMFQRRQNEEDYLLMDIRDAIEDNNPINMAGKLVNQHPIIAGFLGGMALDRLNQK